MFDGMKISLSNMITRMDKAVNNFFRQAENGPTSTKERIVSTVVWTGIAALVGPFLAIGATFTFIGSFFGSIASGSFGSGIGFVAGIIWGAVAAACVGIALALQFIGVPIWLTLLVVYFGACLKFGLWMSSLDKNDEKKA